MAHPKKILRKLAAKGIIFTRGMCYGRPYRSLFTYGQVDQDPGLAANWKKAVEATKEL